MKSQRTNHHSQKSRLLRVIHFWILLIAILGIVGAAFAAATLRGQGRFTGRATFSLVGTNQVAVDLDVAGSVTHLGKSTVHIHSVADVTNAGPTPIPPSTGVIRAANGDTVSFTLRWAVDPLAPGIFYVRGAFDIMGGTGRFKSARGNGEYAGRLDANSGGCSFNGSFTLIP